MNILHSVCEFFKFLFVPQMGRQRRRHELLKKHITYLIGKERAEGNLDSISPLYISRTFNVPIEVVEEVMKDMKL